MMDFLISFLTDTVLLREYGVGAGVFLAVFLGLRLFRRVVLSRIRIWAKKTKGDVDDLAAEVVSSVGQPMYLAAALLAGVRAVSSLPEAVHRLASALFLLAAVAYAAGAAVRVIDYTFSRFIRQRLLEDEGFDASIVRVLFKVIKGAVWGIAIVLLLQNFGYDITALVAGLGIGGLAIAFAFQNILSDIFASFSIYFDRPFKTGDFIIVGGDMGTVEHIGIKSTRLRSLQGEEVIVPNKELTDARVHNYRKMERRRAQFAFGLTYETPPKKLREVPGIARRIIEALPDAVFDRAHFKEFGDFSLNYEVVYYAETADYNRFMDMQEEINLGLVEAFRKEKIEFAYPTQTLRIEK